MRCSASIPHCRVFDTRPRSNSRSRAVSCHGLRREFFQIAERGDAPIATEAVARIAQIYAIEKDVRGTSADERRARAPDKIASTQDALRIFFEHQLTRLSGGSDTARIIRYGLRHWDGLTHFLDHAHRNSQVKQHRASSLARRYPHPLGQSLA
jgi:hypothetical protein